MLGTLYPLLLDALNLGKISVGPPYFEAVFAPLMAPALLLAAIGPLIAWRKGDAAALTSRLRWMAGFALAVGLLMPFAFGRWGALCAFGLALAAWLFAGAFTAFLVRWRSLPSAMDAAAKFRALPSAFFGMLLAHAGVGVFVVGVTLVKAYETERDIRLAPGESATLGGYSFRFDDLAEAPGPNYNAVRARVTVMRDGATVAVLAPEKRAYRVQQSPMTEAAIDAGITRDVYVSLGEAVDGRAWTFRVHVKPFVRWIWVGCLVMALGGLLAASDRRYRPASRRQEDAPAAAVREGAVP
jgi:cytochrome c-type biogenesis protein CcmF